jgi:hypothetical protein
MGKFRRTVAGVAVSCHRGEQERAHHLDAVRQALRWHIDRRKRADSPRRQPDPADWSDTDSFHQSLTLMATWAWWASMPEGESEARGTSGGDSLLKGGRCLDPIHVKLGGVTYETTSW